MNEKNIFSFTISRYARSDRGERMCKAILIKYILKAEHHLKTVIAHEFSKSYGYDNYLKTENFDTSTNEKLKEVLQTIGKLNTVLSNQLNKSKEITHYLTTHGYVPLWVICNNGWYCYNISKKITLVINQGQIHLQIKLLHDLAAQQMSTLNKLKLNNFPGIEQKKRYLIDTT